MHNAQNIAEEGGFSDFTILNPIELGKPYGANHAGCGDAQPVRIVQPEEIAHRANPFGFATIQRICVAEEDIRSALDRRERGKKRFPEDLRHISRATLFIKRMHSTPVIIRCDELIEDISNVFWRCSFESGVELADENFGGSHEFSNGWLGQGGSIA